MVNLPAVDYVRYIQLRDKYEGKDIFETLDGLLNYDFKGEVALVSSFGAESSVLLHVVSRVNKDIPIIFMNTLKLFDETIAYRDTLIERLGLTNVVTVEPDQALVAANDPDGDLWSKDTDACCDIRKVQPLDKVINTYQAWITGRKRFQSATRATIEVLEWDQGRLKINPLAFWSQEQIDQWMVDHELPAHPLTEQNYWSIGCVTCTAPIAAGQDRRAGRWAGQSKTECGIHVAK